MKLESVKLNYGGPWLKVEYVEPWPQEIDPDRVDLAEFEKLFYELYGFVRKFYIIRTNDGDENFSRGVEIRDAGVIISYTENGQLFNAKALAEIAEYEKNKKEVSLCVN